MTALLDLYQGDEAGGQKRARSFYMRPQRFLVSMCLPCMRWNYKEDGTIASFDTGV